MGGGSGKDTPKKLKGKKKSLSKISLFPIKCKIFLFTSFVTADHLVLYMKSNTDLEKQKKKPVAPLDPLTIVC